MPPKKKKASIFRRTPQQRAETRAFGRSLAEVRPTKRKAAAKKPTKTIPAVKKSTAKKAVRAGTAVPKRKPPGAVKKAVRAVKKTTKRVVKTAQTAAARRAQARLKPTAPKHKSKKR